MTKRDDLIRRLCEASEGSVDLSREVHEALGGKWSANEPCITTDLSAAWEEAERRYPYVRLTRSWNDHEACVSPNGGPAAYAFGATPALALCAAMLAAEGER